MTLSQTEINFDMLDGKQPKHIQHRWSDGALLKKAAADLKIRDLKKLSIEATLTAIGKHDWQLIGHVGASVVQSCVVSLKDVNERIDVPVRRRYISDFTGYEAENRSETQLHEDVDPLPQTLDLLTLALEVVALNLSLFPKHRNAALDPDLLSAAPGVEKSNPFGVLQSLKGELDNGGT